MPEQGAAGKSMLWRVEMHRRSAVCYQGISSCQNAEACLKGRVCFPDMCILS